MFQDKTRPKKPPHKDLTPPKATVCSIQGRTESTKLHSRQTSAQITPAILLQLCPLPAVHTGPRPCAAVLCHATIVDASAHVAATMLLLCIIAASPCPFPGPWLLLLLLAARPLTSPAPAPRRVVTPAPLPPGILLLLLLQLIRRPRCCGWQHAGLKAHKQPCAHLGPCPAAQLCLSTWRSRRQHLRATYCVELECAAAGICLKCPDHLVRFSGTAAVIAIMQGKGPPALLMTSDPGMPLLPVGACGAMARSAVLPLLLVLCASRESTLRPTS